MQYASDMSRSLSQRLRLPPHPPHPTKFPNALASSGANMGGGARGSAKASLKRPNPPCDIPTALPVPSISATSTDAIARSTPARVKRRTPSTDPSPAMAALTLATARALANIPALDISRARPRDVSLKPGRGGGAKPRNNGLHPGITPIHEQLQARRQLSVSEAQQRGHDLGHHIVCRRPLRHRCKVDRVLLARRYAAKVRNAEGFGDLLPDKHAERSTLRVDASQKPVHDPSAGDCMVHSGISRTRRSRRVTNLPLQSLPVGDVFRSNDEVSLRFVGCARICQIRNASLMPHDVGDGDVLLPVRPEFGPVRGDPIVVAKKSSVDEHGHRYCLHVLSAGVDALQRICIVLWLLRCVPAEVDNFLPLLVNDELRAQLLSQREVLFERGSHAVEFRESFDRASVSEWPVRYGRCHYIRNAFPRRRRISSSDRR